MKLNIWLNKKTATDALRENINFFRTTVDFVNGNLNIILFNHDSTKINKIWKWVYNFYIDVFYSFIGWVELGPKRLLRFGTKPLGCQSWRTTTSLNRCIPLPKVESLPLKWLRTYHLTLVSHNFKVVWFVTILMEWVEWKKSWMTFVQNFCSRQIIIFGWNNNHNLRYGLRLWQQG